MPTNSDLIQRNALCSDCIEALGPPWHTAHLLQEQGDGRITNDRGYQIVITCSYGAISFYGYFATETDLSDFDGNFMTRVINVPREQNNDAAVNRVRDLVTQLDRTFDAWHEQQAERERILARIREDAQRIQEAFPESTIRNTGYLSTPNHEVNARLRNGARLTVTLSADTINMSVRGISANQAARIMRFIYNKLQTAQTRALPLSTARHMMQQQVTQGTFEPLTIEEIEYAFRDVTGEPS